MPRLARPSRRWAFLAGFAVLGSVPDMPLRQLGRFNYAIRHSLFVNLAVIGVIWLAASLVARFARKTLPRRIMLFATAAWLSHLLLDSFYNHGEGVSIGWPLVPWRLNLPIPWFSTLRGWYAWDLHTLRVVAIEGAFYGGLLAICLMIRLRFLRCATTGTDFEQVNR